MVMTRHSKDKGENTVKTILLACFLTCCISVTSALAADAKLGYFDLQRAMRTSVEGQRVQEQLSLRYSNYQKEIAAKQNELQNLKENLETQSSHLSESDKTSKEKAYQMRLKEFERYTKDAQDDMQAHDKEISGKIIEKTIKTVQEYGKENGYTFIFMKSDALLFTDAKVDLTNDILKILDAAQKGR